MRSFERALELGADALELDVGLCREGTPIVIHDDTLDRTTDGCGAIEAATLSEIRALDAGAWFRATPAAPTTPPRVRVPLLEEVLASFAGRTLVNVEIKTSPRRAELVAACLGAVRAAGALERVVFSSFDHDALRLVATLAPEARLGVLATRMATARALEVAVEIGAENIHPPLVATTKGLVARAHQRSLRVWVWTVNEPADIRRMLAIGVDGLFSDFPERVVAAREAGSGGSL